MRASKKYRILSKKFFFRIRGKNFLGFLFFLLLSASFWLFVVLDEEYEYSFSVNLKMKNVPDNVVITTDLPSTFQIRLKDKGSQLFSYRYTGLPSVTIDYKNYDQYSGHVTIPTSEVVKKMKSRLPSTASVVSYSPSKLEYFYNYGTHIRKPVSLVSNLSTEAMYSISDVRISPDSVTVYALPEVLDTMRQITTQTLSLSGITESTKRMVPLTAVKGVKTIPDKVEVSIVADRITEKSVSVPVRCTNFPASKTLRTFPSHVNVVFQVGMSHYRKITADNFTIVVSYEELLGVTNGTIHLSLKSVPDVVSHVRVIPSDVDFLIEDVVEKQAP